MKLKDSLLRPQRTNAGTIRLIFIVLGTSFQGYWTSKKKQDLVFSVKLRFLRLEKLPKNGCPKCPNPMGSKTSYNGSKMAVFETKIQTKKNKIHQSCGTKRSLFSRIVPKNLKKTRNFDYFILLFWKNKLKLMPKIVFTVFFVLKGNILGFLRAKYTVQSEIHTIPVE